MLYINFGRTEKTISSASRFFDGELEDHWLEDPMVVEMIRDVDNSEVLGNRAIKSPVLGVIAPSELSGGVKALILMLFELEYEYYGTSCGDNCAKWILEIAKKHDLTLSYEHIMMFPEPFEITIVNSGNVVNTMKNLIFEADDHLRGVEVMNGQYTVKVWDKRVNYTFTVKRKITIIRGNSGTGKTTLIKVLERALDNLGANLECSVKCGVITNKHWEENISLFNNSILFIDDDASFVGSGKFAEIVDKSNNYFVLITRAELKSLHYSMDEIYKIKNSGKFNTLVPAYNNDEYEFKLSMVEADDCMSSF